MLKLFQLNNKYYEVNNYLNEVSSNFSMIYNRLQIILPKDDKNLKNIEYS